MDHDQILAAHGGNQMIRLVGSDQAVACLVNQAVFGGQGIIVFVPRSGFGERRPRSDIEPIKLHGNCGHTD